MRIAVYSGSFDPLHIGHLAILERLTGSGRLDRVYLVVSPQNPFKDSSKALSAEQRYRDAVAAVARHPQLRVDVLDIELRMPPPSYTIRTLDELRRREPGNSFTLVIGADNLPNLLRWREAERLLAEYGVAVFPRKGVSAEYRRRKLMEACRDYPPEKRFRIRLFHVPEVDVSSTEIREAQARGEDVSALLM